MTCDRLLDLSAAIWIVGWAVADVVMTLIYLTMEII